MKLAGVDADGHAEVPEVPREDAGVRVEIERPLARVQRLAVCTGERFGIAPCDEQAPGHNAHTLVLPGA
ncbi:MAG: hypothetical protein NTX16_14245 [Actinobacteria bacterium]|nr:hypothetical protein [Actinomycetota bacterium]